MMFARFVSRKWLLAAAVLGLALAPAVRAEAPAEEKLPPDARVVKVEASPAAVTLKQPFDYSQLLLTAHLEGGEQVDVTRIAQVEKPANLVTVSPRGLVRPAADGSGEIKATVGGQTVVVPVTVTGQKDKYPVSF